MVIVCYLWLAFIFLFVLLQVSIPAWFTVDTRLGSLSVHLDTPQSFSAEMYSADLNIVGKPEDDKVVASLSLAIYFSYLSHYSCSI